MGRPIKCIVVCNTANGRIAQPVEKESITSAVRWANDSGYFAYRVLVNGKVVRRGFCDNRW